MEAHRPIVEILVPKAFVWWTFLALATDPSGQFQKARFVDKLRSKPDVIVVHSDLLEGIKGSVEGNTKIIILLWDGVQSYLEAAKNIEFVEQTARQIECRVVGDLSTGDVGGCCPLEWMYLFPQTSDAYDKSIVFSKKNTRMSFPGLLGRWAVIHRSKLISVRVMAQLLLSRRLTEYRTTKFVFCGQTGLGTLERYAREYGIDPKECVSFKGGICCDRSFLVRWVNSMAHKKRSWTDLVVIRALLRLIALRKICEIAGRDIFLNVFPEANINSYQAELLFRRHVFFDFGGIHGDETIYPRSADLHLFKRRVIRFDSRLHLQRLLCLKQGETAMAQNEITRYEEYIVSTFCKFRAEEP
jgi:hypothetical protein